MLVLGSRVSFDLLRSGGQNLAHGTELLEELLRTWPEDRGLRGRITDCEHEGDRLTHKIVTQLRQSKLTPFDRQDIYALAGAIDDVVDDVEGVSEQLVLKHVEAPMDQAQQLAGVLRDSGRELAAALDAIDGGGEVDAHLAHIRRLEQEGDRIYRAALAALFDGAIDPMFVLRWKDIYFALEEAIDCCRAASNRLGSIVVKHA